jgi:hypothetical protein
MRCSPRARTSFISVAIACSSSLPGGPRRCAHQETRACGHAEEFVNIAHPAPMCTQRSGSFKRTVDCFKFSSQRISSFCSIRHARRIDFPLKSITALKFAAGPALHGPRHYVVWGVQMHSSLAVTTAVLPPGLMLPVPVEPDRRPVNHADSPDAGSVIGEFGGVMEDQDRRVSGGASLAGRLKVSGKNLRFGDAAVDERKAIDRLALAPPWQTKGMLSPMLSESRSRKTFQSAY